LKLEVGSKACRLELEACCLKLVACGPDQGARSPAALARRYC